MSAITFEQWVRSRRPGQNPRGDVLRHLLHRLEEGGSLDGVTSAGKLAEMVAWGPWVHPEIMVEAARRLWHEFERRKT